MFNGLSGIKGKIIIPIIGMMVVMLTIIMVIVSASSEATVYRFVQDRLSAATRSIRAYLEAHERQTFIAASAMGGSAELVRLIHNGEREAIWQYTFNQKRHFGVDEIIVANHEGITLARSHMRHSYGDNVSGVPSIAAGLRGEHRTLYTPTPTAYMVMTSTSPIMEEGRIIGSVVVNHVVGSNEFIDRIARIFDVGITVFRGDESVASTLVHPETGARAVGTRARADIAETVVGRGESMQLELAVFGILPYLAYYFPLPGVDGRPTGMFFVGVAQQYAIDTINATRRIMIIIGIFSLLGAALIVYLVAYRITSPLGGVVEVLKHVGEGDLTRTIAEKGNDEISTMINSLNRTIEKIKELIISIKDGMDNVVKVDHALSSDMTETASAMNEITATIQSIKQRMLNQSASVTETNATMEQITANINKLSDYVEKQTSSVSVSSSAIEQMIASINSVAKTMQKNGENLMELHASADVGRSGLQGVAADIQEIAHESEGLMEINAVMQNIASQTNLLSMNAAIEAAHAGESGKGFAVVADEIRKLAENSSVQSKTINDVLKKIKGSIDKITHSTGDVLTKFELIEESIGTVEKEDDNVRRAVEEQREGSKQILEAIALVKDTSQLVKNVSEEMLLGAKEVIREANNLEKVTQEVTNGVGEIVTGAEQVNSAVNNCNQLVNESQGHVGELNEVVSKFRVG